MQIMNLRRRRNALSRVIVASALLGSTLVVGLATAASAAAATHLQIDVQPSSTATNGVALAPQPQISLRDGLNAVDTGNSAVVTATITSGGVSVANATATASSGIATFSGLALTALAGSYTLTFSSPGLTSTVSTSILVSAGAAAQLVITTQPSSGEVTGVPLIRQPVVKVEDTGGNVVTSVNTGTATAAIQSGTGGSILGATSGTFTAGVATFSGLTLTGPSANVYTLSFTGASFTSAPSLPVTLSGPATHLAITIQPSIAGVSGLALAQQPVVKVEDASNNVVVADASTVTAAITSGGVSVTNGTMAVVNGVASFAGLALNATVGTYTLTFSDGSLVPAVSLPVTLAAGAAAKIVITTEPSHTATSGLALVQQPVVKVEDSGGNVITTLNTGAATASINAGAGGAITAGSTANFVAGVATFSGLTLTGVAGTTYTLQFAGGSFTTVDATGIVMFSPQAALSITTTSATWGRSLTLAATGGSGSGALTFAVTGGSAKGCALSGSTLTFSSLGTCIVTATKAGDTTYASTSSSPTAIGISRLPKPGVLRVTFAANSSRLSGLAMKAIRVLAGKLTVKSTVIVTGFAKGNLALARSRATVVVKYLTSRLPLHTGRAYVTTVNLDAAQLATRSQ